MAFTSFPKLQPAFFGVNWRPSKAFLDPALISVEFCFLHAWWRLNAICSEVHSVIQQPHEIFFLLLLLITFFNHIPAFSFYTNKMLTAGKSWIFFCSWKLMMMMMIIWFRNGPRRGEVAHLHIAVSIITLICGWLCAFRPVRIIYTALIVVAWSNLRAMV